MKPKKSLTPREQVDQLTWSMRRPNDPEIRKMIGDLMIAKGLNRTEAVLYLVRRNLRQVMREALDEERAELARRAGDLERLASEYSSSARKPPRTG